MNSDSIRFLFFILLNVKFKFSRVGFRWRPTASELPQAQESRRSEAIQQAARTARNGGRGRSPERGSVTREFRRGRVGLPTSPPSHRPVPRRQLGSPPGRKNIENDNHGLLGNPRTISKYLNYKSPGPYTRKLRWSLEPCTRRTHLNIYDLPAVS